MKRIVLPAFFAVLAAMMILEWHAAFVKGLGWQALAYGVLAWVNAASALIYRTP